MMPPIPGAGPVPGGPPGGGPPGPPGGTGAATAPGAMLGNKVQGMVKLELALKMLQEALAGLPLGSPIHGDVLEALKKLGKHLPQGGAGGMDPQAMIQQLALLAREQKVQPQQQAALSGLMGPGGPPPPGPGAAPPPPGG